MIRSIPAAERLPWAAQLPMILPVGCNQIVPPSKTGTAHMLTAVAAVRPLAYHQTQHSTS
jgi:hypothetical protein